MSVSLRKEIRSVEPQKMLEKAVLLQRTGFLNRQQASIKCTSPLPPRMEQHLAYIIVHGRDYQSSVHFSDCTNQMEATVTSRTDGSKVRRVRLSDGAIPHQPPSCCAYSTNGTGFPCYHGAAVIGEKHGYPNMFKYVAVRHQTSAWRNLYKDLCFQIPSQTDIDVLLTEAKLSVVNGTNVRVPKALPPPRGRPGKNAGRRKQGFYEQGPAAKKMRSYSCSLCRSSDHTRDDCPLRQLFG